MLGSKLFDIPSYIYKYSQTTIRIKGRMKYFIVTYFKLQASHHGFAIVNELEQPTLHKENMIELHIKMV